MSDVIKAAKADAAKAADAALADAGKYANQATIGARQVETQAQGWLRRNVWGVLGAAVVLALIAFWFIVR